LAKDISIKYWVLNYNKKYKKLLNKPLTIAQVKRILRDPVYIGKPRYGEEIVDSSELRFIDADTFSRTQKIMKRIKKRSSGDKNKKIVAIESIIDRFGICYAEKRFKIGVLCPVCGKVMVKNGMRQIRRSGVWVYNYLCQACRKQVRIPSGKQLAQLDRDVGKEPITSKNFFKAP
jgi:hypothetical protein